MQNYNLQRVTGGIEKFKEADTEAHWKDYWIEIDW
jgi:hypothetical protein